MPSSTGASHPGRAGSGGLSFDLLRYFTGVSLVFLLAVSIAAGAVASWLVHGALLHMERDEADSLAENFVTLLRESGFGRERWSIANAKLPDELVRRVRERMDNFGVAEFTLLSVGGRALEDLTAPGVMVAPLWQGGVERARSGSVALRWEAGAWWPLLLLRSDLPGILETYTPVREDGRVVAVARVRRSLSPVVKEAREVVPELVGLAALLGVFVFGSLWLLIYRADRVLKHQGREIDAARQALEQRNRLLEELNRRKDEFYAMCSHDLRGPLLGVEAGCKLLLRQDKTQLSPFVREVISDCQRSSQGVLDLIDNLLDLARIEAGAEEFRPETVNVVPLVDQVVSAHHLLASAREVPLEVVLDVEELWVSGNRAKLLRVFGNLLTNAIKHANRKAVTVRVEACSEGGRVSVCDRGPGIPEDQQVAVFDRFATGSNPAGKRHGTGLGLAIVREFVELHGGRVAVTSVEGRGATFVVTLPTTPSGSPVAVH